MDITDRMAGDVVVLDVAGRVTLGEGGDTVMKEKVTALLDQGHRRVVLNLAGVDYVDSAGLGGLVYAYTSVTKRGGALKIVGVTKRVRDLLSLTKLLTVLPVVASESEAIKSFE